MKDSGPWRSLMKLKPRAPTFQNFRGGGAVPQVCVTNFFSGRQSEGIQRAGGNSQRQEQKEQTLWNYRTFTYLCRS
jgi:hypothetical protein